MDKKISDQQIDRFAAKLLNNFALGDDAIDEIANAPRLWRNVKKQIDEERAQRQKARFFLFRAPVFAFGVAALLVCMGLTALLLTSEKAQDLASAERNDVRENARENAQVVTPGIVSEDIDKNVDSQKSIDGRQPPRLFTKNGAQKFVPNRRKQPRAAAPQKAAGRLTQETATVTTVAETKTDFIALTYGADSESGQIVRVKVPGSLMVSLGLKTNFEKENELVSAEVVVGSDGTARAIRFIR